MRHRRLASCHRGAGSGPPPVPGTAEVAVQLRQAGRQRLRIRFRDRPIGPQDVGELGLNQGGIPGRPVDGRSLRCLRRGGRQPVVLVRQLRKRLHGAREQSKGFHCLDDWPIRAPLISCPFPARHRQALRLAPTDPRPNPTAFTSLANCLRTQTLQAIYANHRTPVPPSGSNGSPTYPNCKLPSRPIDRPR